MKRITHTHTHARYVAQKYYAKDRWTVPVVWRNCLHCASTRKLSDCVEITHAHAQHNVEHTPGLNDLLVHAQLQTKKIAIIKNIVKTTIC